MDRLIGRLPVRTTEPESHVLEAAVVDVDTSRGDRVT